MSERGSGEGAAELTAQAKRAADEAERRARETSRVKFDASEEQLKRSTGDIALGGVDAKPEQIKPQIPPQASTQKPTQAPQDGMNRLLRAKKKAQDEMDGESNG